MKTIAILSTAGGAGRTTLTAALAMLLARRGRPVVAVDFDPQNLLGAHLGLDELPPAGIGAAITSDAPWHAHTWSNEEGVLFVPYGEMPDAPDGALASLPPTTLRLAEEPDWLARSLGGIDLPGQGVVLIDTPRYPSMHAAQALRCADLVVCVTPPEPGALATLVRHLPKLRAAGKRPLFVLNRLNPAREMQRDALSMLTAALGRGVAPVMRLHADAALPEAFARGSWLFDDAPYSQTSHDLHGLASAVEEQLAALDESSRVPGAELK
ncbi:cellulose biosynthesis protein BcsQ [Paraburkholderia sp. MPAMCS5]|uniref:cellulose biosynthesis protein BcsQ n=1 Tax=Paraburkholderia sp. MPAMCS5 TaxID=3112563 RepID=UPI002E1703AA|nr:cellulose biosynthesis protein BcsQ [Paraburkholderia sp. MPAMCS5]